MTIPTYLLCDTETTGFDDNARVLEIAALLLDAQFEPVSEEFYWAFEPPALWLDAWHPKTRDFHEASGLIEEFFDDDFAATGDVDAFRAALDEFCRVAPDRLILTGYSPQFDRRWLRQISPIFVALTLSHQMLDISTLRMVLNAADHTDLVERSRENLGDVPHRALGDVRYELQHLQNYRDLLWRLE